MYITTLATVLLAAAHSTALRSSGNGVLTEPEPAARRIAIIGAGAAGSSAAYHLSNYAADAGIPANISVFERNDYIGGRTTTVHPWGDPEINIELGGSIFVSVNRILVTAASTFNLSAADLSSTRLVKRGTPELGIWDGKQFVVTVQDGWWDKAKLLWRYGRAPFKTNSLMKETVGKFLTMYEAPVFPWKSLTETVVDVGLMETVGVTGEQYLRIMGVGDKYAREVISASTRVNYASNLGLIHGLETMVCMATNGAMAIAGGNWQIFAHMLKSSPSTTTHLKTAITKVAKQPDNTYTLTASKNETSTFDEVILAGPYQFSGIEFDPKPENVPDEIPYVALHVTLFASPFVLDPVAFGLKASEVVPQFVLTILPEGEDYNSNPNGQGSPGFFSISLVNEGLNPHAEPPRPEYIYKIFSAQRVTPAFLSKILGHDIPSKDADDEASKEEDVEVNPNGAVSWILHKLWHSYPYEYPRVTFEELQLDTGLWYTGGIESFISTMETSALMGKNIARLIVDGWEGLAMSEGGGKVEGIVNEKNEPIQNPIGMEL